MNRAPMDILSAVQTRSGLNWVKQIWLEAIENNPWMDSSYVRDSLWIEHALVFPLFAIKYSWNGAGKLLNFIKTISLKIILRNEDVI